jgi:hypothetical protein
MDMTLQKQIIKILAENGISPADIDFRGSKGEVTFFRYQYWRCLPEHALEAISHLVIEDLYEDDDGDDDRGRPIIRRMYSYQFKNA